MNAMRVFLRPREPGSEMGVVEESGKHEARKSFSGRQWKDGAAVFAKSSHLFVRRRWKVSPNDF